MRLTIVPFKSMPGGLARAVARQLRSVLPWRFVVAPSVADPLPRISFDPVDVDLFWPLLPHSARHDELSLGLTAIDITARDLGTVFGYADNGSHAAIVSAFRLVAGTQGRRGGHRLLIERITREALHEAGHLMGLPHCPRPGCVMQYSQTLHDTDIKQSRFCPECLRELSRLPESSVER